MGRLKSRKSKLIVLAVVIAIVLSVVGVGVKSASAAARFSAQPDPCQKLGTRILKLGSVGQDVANLQQCQISKGFAPLKADGYFGPLTQHAVFAVQKHAGLKVDGVVGPQTKGNLPHAAAVRMPSACSGVVVCINKASQMAYVSNVAGMAVLAFDVSTGNAALGDRAIDTPSGRGKICRQDKGWTESKEFPGGMMYNASYIDYVGNGKPCVQEGVAIHGSKPGEVRTTPASHGCIRSMEKVMDVIYQRLAGASVAVI